ncbi:hypothetical protein ACIQXI_05165 [Lysinibacillus sp. NPDC097195]|uniref:hypothetical protein n=1 Tax=Lysinibacillus sp. NPDC097195 TaxID=3364141 RepID=UPI00380DE574
MLEKVEHQPTKKLELCRLTKNRQWGASIQTEQKIEHDNAIISTELTKQQIEEMMQIIEGIRLNGYNIKM